IKLFWIKQLRPVAPPKDERQQLVRTPMLHIIHSTWTRRVDHKGVMRHTWDLRDKLGSGQPLEQDGSDAVRVRSPTHDCHKALFSMYPKTGRDVEPHRPNHSQALRHRISEEQVVTKVAYGKDWVGTQPVQCFGRRLPPHRHERISRNDLAH